MTPNETAERAAFEAAYLRDLGEAAEFVKVARLRRRGDSYDQFGTEQAWKGWQWARAASPVTPQEDQAVASQAVSAAEGEARAFQEAWHAGLETGMEAERRFPSTPSPRDCDSPASVESALVVAARKAVEPCTHCNGKRLLPWRDGSTTMPCPWCSGEE